MFKACKNCQQNFEITTDDLKFYDKISPVFNGKKYQIPAPTFCPSCRQQRRMAIRNERNLYHRKCDMTGKQIISMYHSSCPFPVYSQDEWYSDKWDGLNSGQEYNFDKSFFEQFKEVRDKTPHQSLISYKNENCSFCNVVGTSRNCYLIFGSINCEDCFYGSPYNCKNCIDSLVLRNSELCYECIDSDKLYSCSNCQNCANSFNLRFCYEVTNSNNCLACVGLNQKEFCILNKQYSKNEYEKIINQTNFSDHLIIKEMDRQLNELKLKIPHKYYVGLNNENFSGNYIFNSKNTFFTFNAEKCEDVKFMSQMLEIKDSMDSDFGENGEMQYECSGFYHSSFNSFCYLCWDGINNLFYCSNCTQNTNNCFGCVGLKHKNYCILNKQYTKEKYEILVPKIIEQMQKPIPLAPFIKGGQKSPLDKGDLGDSFPEFGEFFPSSISTFGYNESIAQEYFHLTKDQAIAKKFKWKDEDLSSQHQGPEYKIQENIQDVKDDISNAILRCEITGKLYKIIPQELNFYRQMNLPVPKKCPDQRHQERLALRNPRKLWDRNCMKCGEKIKTTYAPSRPEITCCDNCYSKEVY